MTWEEIEDRLRAELANKPYGYQTELAQRLGVTRAYVSQIVNKHVPIGGKVATKLAEELGLELVVQLRSAQASEERDPPKNIGEALVEAKIKESKK